MPGCVRLWEDRMCNLFSFMDEDVSARYVSEALDCNAVQAVAEYSIWGGIPRYWELRKDYRDSETAIRNLLLDIQGILLEEPQRLLRDDMRDVVQSTILLSIIGEGTNKISEIASRAGKPAGEDY